MLSAVPPATCSRWLALADAAYQNDVASISDFVAESSSFRLRAVAGLSVADVWSALSSHVRAMCANALGLRLVVDVDQCWVRRQYAPGSAPPRHHPHSWHQDGALGLDFAHGDAEIPDDALLPMVTCWIALVPCGVEAPGLELVADRVDRLLSPAQLADGVVEGRWPTSRRTHPTLVAGDALVFSGDVLHRTHLSASMNQTRTSIELRCFAADGIPDRIAHDEFVAVPAKPVECFEVPRWAPGTPQDRDVTPGG